MIKTRTQRQGSTKKAEYDVEIKAMAVAFRLKGDSYRKIGDLLGIPYPTVQSIVLKFKETGSVKNKKRSGCPQKLKAEDIEALKHDVLEDRQSRTMPLAGITEKFNEKLTIKVSETTIRRTLQKQGIACFKAAKKPFINEVNAAKRVQWCQERVNWTVEDWKKVYLLSFIQFHFYFYIIYMIFLPLGMLE